jgi:hypothetical protein
VQGDQVHILEQALAAIIDVSPLALDFGNIVLPSSSQLIVTLSNAGGEDLTITGVALQAGGSSTFLLPSSPKLPSTLTPGASMDVTVAFEPTALAIYSATLEVTSDDADEPTVEVQLTGAGVPSEDPPSEQIVTVIDFTDTSVAEGTLAGDGPGGSRAGRLNALKNQIEAAGDLIDAGDIAATCDQLLDAYKRTEGVFPPPDFVTGEAAAELALLIEIIRDGAGCSGP